MEKEKKEKEHKNKDLRTNSLEKTISMKQKRTNARKKVKPELKDYLAIIIALLETTFLPFVIMFGILIALGLIFSILIQ